MLYCIFFCLHFLSNIYSVVCCTVYGVLLKCTSTIWHQSVFFLQDITNYVPESGDFET